MHVVGNLIFVLALTVFPTSGDLCGKEIFYEDRYIDIEKFEIEEQGRAGEGKFLAHLKLNLENCTRACCENEKCNVISYDNNEKDKIKKRCYLYECVPLKDCEGNLVSKAGLDTIFIDKLELQSVSNDNSNMNENSKDPNEPIYSKTKDQGVDLAVQDSGAGIASLKPTSTAPSPQSSSSPLSEFGVNNNSDAGPQLDSNENSEEQPPPLSSETGILNNGTADSNEPINSGKLPTSSSASPSKAMSSASVAKTNKENLPSSAHTTTSITGTNSSSTSTSSTTSSSSTTSTTTTTTATPQSAKQQENENPQNTETNGTDNNDNEGISETNSSNTQVTTTTKTPTTIAPISNSTRTSTTTTSATPESVMKPTTQAKQATATPSTTVQQNSESNTSTETISPKENNNAEESTTADIQHTTVLSGFLKPDNTDAQPQKQLNTSQSTTEQPKNSLTPATRKPMTTLSTVSQTNTNQISNQSNTSIESVATTSQKTILNPVDTATPSEKTTSKSATSATTFVKTTNKPATTATPSERTTSVHVSTPSKETTISKVTDVKVAETTTQMALPASKASETQSVTYKPEVITSPFVNSMNKTNSTQLENLFYGNKDGHPSHAWSAALIAALSFGILFFVSVLAIIAKRCFDGWQRRHYSRIDYLVNGMYN